MTKTGGPPRSRQTHQHKKRNKQTYQKNHSYQTKTSASLDSSRVLLSVPHVRAPTLAAAPATPAPAWLGPCASWHADRNVHRVDQPRHTTPPPDDTVWTARLYEYLDRDEGASHIPPRVYNTVIDTARTPSRTTFARYGWVHTFAEYDAYAAANPGKYAYELWFGHRGLARASLDARQALIRDSAEYGDRGVRELYNAEGDAIPDNEAVYSANETEETIADYADDGYNDGLLFPMDPDEATSEDVVVEEGTTDNVELTMADIMTPKLLHDCEDDDTF